MKNIFWNLFTLKNRLFWNFGFTRNFYKPQIFFIILNLSSIASYFQENLTTEIYNFSETEWLNLVSLPKVLRWSVVAVVSSILLKFHWLFLHGDFSQKFKVKICRYNMAVRQKLFRLSCHETCCNIKFWFIFWFSTFRIFIYRNFFSNFHFLLVVGIQCNPQNRIVFVLFAIRKVIFPGSRP